MRRRTSTVVLTFTATAIFCWLAACGGNRAAPPPMPASAQGTWNFTASVPAPGGGLWFEGSFTAVGDTLLLEVKGAECFPTRGGTDTFGYRCPGQFGSSRAQQTVTGATFSFWRHKPTERASVTVSLVRTTTRRSCAQYTTDSGARVCARMSTEIVDVPSTQSAILKVTPVR